MIDLLTVGETMALVAPVDAEPLSGATRLRLGAAGAESNVAACAAQLGLRTRWVSRLGDDALGHRVRAAIRDGGVDVDFATLEAGDRTGVMFKDPALAEGTQVAYYRDGSAASRLTFADLESAATSDAAVLHLTGITLALSPSSRDLVLRALRGERPLARLTSFDVNHRPALWPDRDAASELAAAADLADVVFVGLDEAERLWGTRTSEEVRRLLPGPERLVVKDGAVGATVLRLGRPETFVPSLRVEVVEPVGAGDAFAGGFLTGLVRGLDDDASCRLGHLAAAAVLGSTSDHAQLPPIESLMRTATLTDDEWGRLCVDPRNVVTTKGPRTWQ